MAKPKITDLAQLTNLRERLRKQTGGTGIKRPSGNKRILVCTGGGCVASGSLDVSAALKAQIKKHRLERTVTVVETGCLGPCAVGPVLVIEPEGILYQEVKPADAVDIIRQQVQKGQAVTRLLHHHPITGQVEEKVGEVSFLNKQRKIALRNCGVVDPSQIEDYIRHDGYQALAKVLTGLKPEAVIETVKRSGLRGRGGAGFSTGLKWSFTSKSAGSPKFVLCNADEGDPGAFMDRSILEGDPHSVIEAMAIAGFAIGSAQGYVYVRAEYPLAVKRLSRAIEQARAYGLLGKNLLGSGFDFDLEIRMGSGAFVCGEETALMTSIEGNRGEPRPRPPFPAEKGLWGKPSLLNNVETYANIPKIILEGAEWYASLGTEKSKGTKVFALAGAVRMTGLVEIPIGTPLGEIIYDIGGGILGKKQFKAAQIGGPSGGCIPRQHLNVPVDYESLTELGAIMGSGGLVIMDEDSCMVDVARFFLEFVQDESCGKCTPCRIGTKRMLEILERICQGQGQPGDVERLVELGTMIKDTALCGLGQTAPNPVLSTIRHFRDEYDAHIIEKRCPAGVCPELVRAPCQNACPAGVDVPGFVSLIREKQYAAAVRLHRERNPFVSVCARVCFHPCESKCRRVTLDEPVAVRSLKRFMADQEGRPQLPGVRKNTDNARRRVGIIGAGPAGLSCAYFLARLGYRPTVFEAGPEPGGMLVQTIPQYRLPRTVLKREIDMIRRMGVTIKTNTALGREFVLADLKEQGYEAVFLSTGAPRGQALGIPGEDQRGITDALDFLRTYHRTGKVAVGRRVVVVGGGNAAVDAARTAVRLGAGSVTILYRRTRIEMPAYEEEIEAALAEGVRLVPLAAPLAVKAENGSIAGVQYQQMALGAFDASGRRRPEPTATEALLPADQVITAIGQQPEAGLFGNGDGIKLTSRGYINGDRLTGQTAVPWIFAGGDLASGPASVVEAIAAGERAATGMDRYLTGADHAFWRKEQENTTAFDPEAEPVSFRRARCKETAASQRRRNFREIEHPLPEAAARREARRCLRCDYRLPEA